jgi:hypothetical protein
VGGDLKSGSLGLESCGANWAVSRHIFYLFEPQALIFKMRTFIYKIIIRIRSNDEYEAPKSSWQKSKCSINVADCC